LGFSISPKVGVESHDFILPEALLKAFPKLPEKVVLSIRVLTPKAEAKGPCLLTRAPFDDEPAEAGARGRKSSGRKGTALSAGSAKQDIQDFLALIGSSAAWSDFAAVRATKAEQEKGIKAAKGSKKLDAMISHLMK
jgi:hypothetical protein